MDLKLFCFVSGLSLLTGSPLFALYNLIEVSADVDESADEIRLSWDLREASAPTVIVSRRIQGQTGAQSWNEQISLPRTTTSWTDSNVTAGVIYEYQFLMPPEVEGGHLDVTAAYVSCGYEVALNDDRGVVLLVVDETLVADLGPEIQRYEMDLVGDGWTVQRLDFARDGTGSVEGLRSEIQTRNAATPLTSIVLFGRLPILESGYMRPDEHNFYRQATDLIYADLDGNWQDVRDEEVDGQIYYPGDGHYDERVVPGPNGKIEIAVGRIDLSGMTAWPQGESELLRRYLDKNHNFRHLSYTVPREGYFTSLAFDTSPVEAAAVAAMLGPENCHEIYDNGEFEQANPLLWGIAARDWNGDNYPNYRFKSQFTVNFASGKQVWQWDNNTMRAMLAMPWYGLGCCWGVRPNWFFHHMGMGGTFGQSTLRTVNNNDNFDPAGGLDYEPSDELVEEDFPEGVDGYVHLNLMGDPTLRMHPVAPARELQAAVSEGVIALSWQGSVDPDVSGYHVYLASEARGPYTRITASPQAALVYNYNYVPPGESWFMVRPVKLENTPVGTYWNAGQGIFAKTISNGSNSAPVAIAQTVSTEPGAALTVTAAGRDPDGDSLAITIAANAENGEVTGEAPNFIYTPAAGFEGVDSFQFNVWDGVSESTGTITIEVEETGGVIGNPELSYQEWADGIDWQGQDSSADGNPDDDELSNFWEFYQGYDPFDGTSSYFNRMELIEVGGDSYFEIEAQRRKSLTGLRVEVSFDELQSWTALSETNLEVFQDAVDGDSSVELIRTRLPLDDASLEKAFFRLSVSPQGN